MKLDNQFRVALPVDEAWSVLTDIERIAPCLPGAQLQEVEGEEHRGRVKVKVGPMTAQYKGTAVFEEKDPKARRAVIRAEGRETRGQGKASAVITAELTGDGEGTVVTVTTDLTIVGRVAQAGHGILEDVSRDLIDQFVRNLEVDLEGSDESGERAPADGVTPTPINDGSGSVRRIAHPENEPIDLLGAAGGPVIKRLAPAAAVALLLLLILRRISRR